MKTLSAIMEDVEKRLKAGEQFDIHRAVAAGMFGVSEAEVTSEMRGVAKARSYIHWYNAPSPTPIKNELPWVTRVD